MNDDIQSKMEFIINQQAQFAANIQAHDERLNRLENIVTRLAEATVSNVENLNESRKELEEAQKRVGEALERLAEAQAHTDKRLDALIYIVREERERRNGKS
ncbi:MAG: hypothetical protein ICV60_02035 [Pyrinomonadaceae bacterium]|nr:hypothetical protein [Pyrinomonadaceae bacterium]